MLKTLQLLALGLVPFTMGGCLIVQDDARRALPYEACFDSFDCDDRFSDACYQVEFDFAVEGMCSNQCRGDFDCQGDGACLELSGSGVDLCYDRCFSLFDCEPGFVCVETTSLDAICLPN